MPQVDPALVKERAARLRAACAEQRNHWLATLVGSALPVGSPAIDRSAAYLVGFERAYSLTFVLSLVALGLGVFLPGWPGRLGPKN